MNSLNIVQPDVTLHLDMQGVIRDVSFANSIAEESEIAWLGHPWADTVPKTGTDRIRRMVEDARSGGVCGFRQVVQRFPSGLELPMEYTTVRVADEGGLVAIGKNLKAITDLQSRLVAAQQAMERDYWKLREIETRYRLLFDSSNEAVLLVSASDMCIIEANPVAIRALGLAPIGRKFLQELVPDSREAVEAMLLKVREHGKAPGILVHLGREQTPWVVRASLMTSEPGPAFLIQLTAAEDLRAGAAGADSVSIEDLLGRAPDAFVVIDREGVVVRANLAFLDLVQVGAEGSVVGERLGRWLGRPGADMTVVLDNVRRHAVLRRFATTLRGELGTETEVEISATGNADTKPEFIGAIIRDVSQRQPTAEIDGRLGSALDSATAQIGTTSLRTLVNDTVSIVERNCIDAALELTGGNRTAAAELLGLSRQSLHAKLNRYAANGDSERSRVGDG